MNSEVIAIIMASYNGDPFYKKSIDSVLNQSYKKFVLFIIDDGSSKKTKDLLTKISNKDKRIHLYFKENGGPFSARNYGLNKAKNFRFIAFIDQDDYWFPAKLEKQIFQHLAICIPLSFTKLRKFKTIDDQEVLSKEMPLKNMVDVDDISAYNPIALSTVMIDKKVVKNMYFINSLSSDYYMWTYIIKNYGPAFLIDEDLCRYRLHHNNLSGNKFKAVLRYLLYQFRHNKFNGFKIIRNFLIYAYVGIRGR